MSCIIAMVNGSSIYFASDSLAVCNGVAISNNCKKIFRKKYCGDEFLVGVTGTVFACNIIDQLDDSCFIRSEISSTNFYDFLCNEFRHELMSHFLSDSNGKDIENEKSTFLIGHLGKLYFISNDLSVVEVDKFFSIGSGAECATGAMEVLYYDKKLKPKEKLNHALSIASKYDIYVNDKFNFEELYFGKDSKNEDIKF